jgi:hypothetical protein
LSEPTLGPAPYFDFGLDLLAQHQQFGILPRRRRREQRHLAGHADQDQVEHPYGHNPVIRPAARPPQHEYPQVIGPCPDAIAYASTIRHGFAADGQF